MSAEDSIPDTNSLYVGEGVTIKGEVVATNTVVVCGVIEGDVSAGNLLVGETGAIKGRTVVAQNAEIAGKVLEKLDVRALLVLRSTGRVDGKISYGMLQIEQGATVAGGISAAESRSDLKPAKTETRTRAEQRPGAFGNGTRPSRLSEMPDVEPLGTPIIPPAR